MDQARTPARRQRLITWTTATEWPLTIAAVVFLVAYSWEVIANLQGPARRAAELVINVTWALFGLDYVIRLALSQIVGTSSPTTSWISPSSHSRCCVRSGSSVWSPWSESSSVPRVAR